MKITNLDTLKSIFTKLINNDPSLKTVEVECELEDFKMFALIEAATLCSTLTSITFPDINTQYLFDKLKQNDLPIKKLTINRLIWLVDEVGSLLNALKYNSTLIELNLNFDSPQPNNLVKLKEVLENNKSLKTLKIEGYSSYLNHNYYSNISMEIFYDSLEAFLSFIKGVKNIEYLFIDVITEPAIIPLIAKALENNTTLLELYLGEEGKPISDEITRLLERNRAIKAGKQEIKKNTHTLFYSSKLEGDDSFQIVDLPQELKRNIIVHTGHPEDLVELREKLVDDTIKITDAVLIKRNELGKKRKADEQLERTKLKG